MPGRSRPLLILFTSIAILAGTIALIRHETVPQYKGRSLSEWLEIANKPRPNVDPEARAAILAIGTNVLPYLL